MTSVDVSVVIVGTNEKEYVVKCLNSLRSQKTRYHFEILVIDNASQDGTGEMVRHAYPDVRLFCNTRREGYIQNNNFAFRQAHGRYLLMLNADIELMPENLEVMISFMDQHPGAAVAACKLLYEDGVLQLTCRRFPTPWTYLHRAAYFFRWTRDQDKLERRREVRRYLMLDYDHQATREVDWILTAYFLIRRSALDQLGMLDERMVKPFYLEDVEWCFRARVQGWKIYYVPETTATHYYQRGSAKQFNWLSVVHMLNILYFFAKHGWSMIWEKHQVGQNPV